MVERTDNLQGKSINYQKLKSLSSTHCKILMRFMPNFGEDFPHYNLPYLAKVISINQGYLEEVLDWLVEKDIVEFDGQDYYLTHDCVWKVQEVINLQPAVLLKRKIESFEGKGGDD